MEVLSVVLVLSAFLIVGRALSPGASRGFWLGTSSIALWLAALLSACGGEQPPSEPEETFEPTVTEVTVEPSSAEVTAVGDTKRFEAEARNQRDDPMTGVDFSWRSSDRDVATVDSSGTAVGRNAGTATISAIASGVADSALLRVDQEVADVAVAPDSARVTTRGGTVAYSAAVSDENGNEVNDARIAWTTTDSSVVVVDTAGVAGARGDGTAEVVASAAGVRDSALFVADLGPPAPTPVTQLLPARFETSAVWDRADDRLLVYGGSDSRVFTDTWAYDPSTGNWSELATSNAPRRKAHGAVWARGRGVMYVVAGNDGGGGYALTNDVYRLDPSTGEWARLGTSGSEPRVRSYPAVAWDPIREQILMFGGKYGDFPDILGDLWAFDPDAREWTKLSSEGEGPGPRTAPTGVWDPGRERMIVYGGRTVDRGRVRDIWEYDPDDGTWRQRPQARESSPIPRFRHQAAWDGGEGRMVVFGGCCARGRFNDVWAWSPAANRWEELAPGTGMTPAARFRFSAAWDPDRDALLVYGGQANEECYYLNDLWAYRSHTDGWLRLSRGSEAAPLARIDHGVAALGGRAYVFGGCQGSGATDALLTVEAGSGSVDRLEASGRWPGPRNAHSLVAAPSAGKLLLFAGYRADASYGDLWAYDVDAGSWEQLSSASEGPGERIYHGAAWSPGRGELFVFGGRHPTGDDFGDLWSWDLDEGEWTRLSTADRGPGLRERTRVAWDPEAERLLVYGGYVHVSQPTPRTEIFTDLWSYRPQSDEWRKLASAEETPPARFRSTAAWDDRNGRFLLYGGMEPFASGGEMLGELWTWNPDTGEWSRLDVAGPSPRSWIQGAWIPELSRWMVVGGYGGPQGRFFDQAWSWGDGSWSRLR